ncbi:HEAT repeat domain-containing protein, partial [bacterium]|nr:HEAT repeat domain-containing protein [bacterium]
MDLQNKKLKIYSSILESLFLEIYKDGKVLDSEKEISKLLISNLNIPIPLYKKVREEVLLDLKPSKSAGAFNTKNFLYGIKSKLKLIVSPKEVNQVIQRIAGIVDYTIEADDLLEKLSYNPKNLIHPDKSVRSLELYHLITSELKDKHRILQNLLKREKDLELRYEIQKALGADQSLTNLGQAKKKEGQPLTNIIESKNIKEVRHFCIHVAKKKSVDQIEVNLQLQERWDDANFKASILSLLPFLDSSYHNELDQYFHDSDFRIIAKAIETAEIFGNRSYLPQIIELVNCEDNRIKANAIKALHAFGEDGVFEALESMCYSEYTAYRDSAAYTLLNIELEYCHVLLEK